MNRSILLLAAIPLTAYSWVHTYGNIGGGYCVRETFDGCYIVSGFIGESLDSTSQCLMKVDTTGVVIWTARHYFTMGGAARCVAQTADGGYVTVGATFRYDGAGDLILIKTDEYGDTVWTRVYGSWWEDGGRWVEETEDGGFILTGMIQPTGSGKHMWVLRTDDYGDTTWTRNYKPFGDRDWFGNCVQPTTNGGYIVGGSAVLMKMNSSGDSLWTSPYGSACVRQSTDGGYIMATSHNQDIWIIKTDSQGDTIWTSTYGGADEDYSYEVQQTTDGGYIVVGSTRSFGEGYNDVWLLKTDSLGDTLWTRTIGGYQDDKGFSVAQTADNGYIITGYTFSYGQPGDFSKLWLVKTDSLGNVGVQEPIPVTHQPDWEVMNTVGRKVLIRSSDLTGELNLEFYDSSGRKVDECSLNLKNSTLTWGEGFNPGVYFVREESGQFSATRKVVLIR